MSSAAQELGPDRTGRVLRLAGDRVLGFARPDPAVGVATAGEVTIEPGRINAHTHIYSALAPLGMPPPESAPRSFLEILELVWWRLDRALDAASLAASARLYAAQALLAGTTTLIDHHESPALIEGSLDILADACQDLGVRAALCFGATERNGGRDEARRGLAECRRFVEGNRRPLVRGLVGLHASFTVSDETARAAGALARGLGTVVHVHLAEDGADVEDARRRGYPGPLERLLALDALPRGSILAHGVCCDAAQVRLAAAAGLWIVQNPRSNRGNRVGYPAALGASPRVALGTDGYPARMEEEAAVLAEEGARHGEPPGQLEARVAGAWGLAAELWGRPFAPLAAGAAADLVVRAAAGVDEVWVAGRRVVAGGRLLGADLDEIRAAAAAEATRLWQRMRELAPPGPARQRS